MEQRTPSENDFSAVLGNILSNPEMLSSIKSIAEKLKNDNASSQAAQTFTQEETVSAQSAAPESAAPTSAKATEAISALAPLLSADFSKLAHGDDKRACLLRALKPYLSDGRCEAIEYIIKFSAISNIIKNFS